ncbi:MAG: hypothetical protein A2Y40_03980 [Candidatus Margulisbacteria bacterium GWF2_35_9]|nr:MAG: hypothetical protein A2Y40_03980 [Candidatus Margulisbacteria bacterium GWF2_35_9]
MLKKLSIENYLFIEKTTLEFSPNLNVIIGESGVGKSMIVNILSIPLGFKPGSKVVGQWGKEAVINILFEVDGLKKNLHVAGIESSDECNTLEIRIIINKKMEFFINGEIASIKSVKILTELILDIHSQNNYSIFQEDQLGILNRFMSVEEKDVLNEFRIKFDEYSYLRSQLQDIERKIISEVDLDFYKFQMEEIKKINPQIDEDKTLFEELKNNKTKMNLVNKIQNIRLQLDETCSSGEKALIGLNYLYGEDESLKGLKERFEISLKDMDDVLWEFTRKEQQYSEVDETSIDNIEDRINILEDLKRKYRKSIEEIITYQHDMEQRLSSQDDYKHDIEKSRNHKLKIKSELDLIAEKLSSVRQIVADRVMHQMKIKLLDLKLGKTDLTASFIKKNEIDENGYDNFNFLIKVNVGSNFYQFDKLSGGETSRVMLALKAALMSASTINVYIFDEIDAGVSGDIAIKMGNVLKQMSVNKQLIIITHLPIIAVKADKLFKIEKTFIKESTVINVESVNTEKDKLEKLSLLLTEKPNNETIAYVKSLQ